MENEMSKILKEIRVDINFIKNNMVDIDCILTSEEARGETTSLEYFKKEMELIHKHKLK